MVKRRATSEEQVTPTKKRKSLQAPDSPPKSIYAQARSALRLSALATDQQVLGRDGQRQQLHAFLSLNFPHLFPLHDASNAPTCHALYVSGLPGTGKTVLIREMLEQPLESGSLKGSILNCTALDDIWSTVLTAMSSQKKLKGLKAKARIEELACSEDQPPFLLVLDEADHLKDDSVLPFFYALSAKPDSKLSVIGIANSLDLASRLSFSKHNVGAIEFTPYTAADMSLIAKQRLLPLSEDSSTLPCIAAPALELASKRVAGVSGDLRTFLSIVRKAIELVEPSSSSDAPSSSSPAKATPSHVLKALKACSLSAVHNPSAALETALESAPFHARIVLASLCISFARLASSTPSSKGKASTESITYDSAWSIYSEVLKQAEKEMMAQSRGDYENLLDTLAVIGLATLQTVSMPSPKSKSKNSPRSSSSQRQRTISLVHPLTLNEAAVKHGEGEAAAVVAALFNAETRKQKKKLRLKEWDEAAPMSGFHGDGLDGKEERMMGKAARGRNEDPLEEEDDL